MEKAGASRYWLRFSALRFRETQDENIVASSGCWLMEKFLY